MMEEMMENENEETNDFQNVRSTKEQMIALQERTKKKGKDKSIGYWIRAKILFDLALQSINRINQSFNKS